jgi:hypothetical protein
MNWEALGSFAELVGAAGVIASLLYVAAQVRTANRAAAVHAKLESTRLLNDFMDLLIERPDLNLLMRKGRTGLASLSPDEYQQYSNMSLKAFWFFSAGYFQYRRRTLAESDWHEIRAVAVYWLQGPGCREWWEKLGRSMYGAEFVAFVDSEIAMLATQQATEIDATLEASGRAHDASAAPADASARTAAR